MNTQQFNLSIDLMQQLLWQHENKPNLQSLVSQKQAFYDTEHSTFWADWITNVFDLRTANQFGLSVWAQLLNVPIQFTISRRNTIFGFGIYRRNFGRGTFAANQIHPLGVLTLTEWRQLLQLRYWQLVSRGAIPETNKFYAFLFGNNQNMMLDYLNMEIRHYFNPPLSSNMIYNLTTLDILVRPAGVKRAIITPSVSVNAFGFGSSHKNFNRGNFHSGINYA